MDDLTRRDSVRAGLADTDGAIDPMDTIDGARYPLTPSDPRYRDVVACARADLRETGCTVLPGFVRAARVEALRRECATVAGGAYYDVETVNVYNTTPAPELPDDHPARIELRRGNAFVARDQIPDDFVVHRLYTAASFRRFVADCFGLDDLYELADPLAGLCLNVVTPGMEHPWHFDTNEFAVSMVTQAPRAGGAFEYCPNIRSAGAENVGDVRSVLTGTGDRLVRRLALRPGSLQLFRGRYSMHRVTTVGGDTARHSAIFAYSRQPGVVGNPERTRQLFGRLLPEHVDAAGHSIRGDRLLD